MPEIDETVKEAVERAEGGSSLNSAVAILVALTATLMALSHIKDENIRKVMEHDESKAVDTWSFYQAKSTKQHLMEFGLDQAQLHLEADGGLTPAGRQRYEQSAKKYDTELRRYAKEKEGIQKQAEGYEAEYEHLNVHHDQFNVAEALYSVAIAIAGITALTRKKWLFFMAIILCFGGLLFSVAGFAGWGLHAQLLEKLLGT